MKTRPYFVTQSQRLDLSGLERSAVLLAERMEGARPLRDVIGYGRVLIRVMKIIMEVALGNECFERRRIALSSPKSRAQLSEILGGAVALKKWRRKAAWNAGRLDAIAKGEYRAPNPLYDGPQSKRRPVSAPASKRAARKSPKAKPPAAFRLPPQRDLLRTPVAPPAGGKRAAPCPRSPSIVIWPHEIDGQYVPDFVNRARRPACDTGGDYMPMPAGVCEAAKPPLRPPQSGAAPCRPYVHGAQ